MDKIGKFRWVLELIVFWSFSEYQPSLTPPVYLLPRGNIGASRGFAFVEFSQVEHARKWIEEEQVASEQM